MSSWLARDFPDEYYEDLVLNGRSTRTKRKESTTMDVSEDGTVTGSVDVSKLDEIDPKTDEAKAQLEALKAQAAIGQEQAKEQEKAAQEAQKADEKAAKEAEKKAEESSKEQQKAVPKPASHSGKE